MNEVAAGASSSASPPTAPGGDLPSRLNWLRAGVLGANDGIVSTAGLVLGVAGASSDHRMLLTAGIAALVSGALSMATGEYVSVSTQRDTERAAVERIRDELAREPQREFDELVAVIVQRGLSRPLACRVATELTQRDAVAAHSEIELGIRLGEYANPWQAAGASALSFALGALVPLLSVVLARGQTVVVTLSSVVVALAVTGYVSARLGDAPPGRAVLRNVAGGVVAMLVTYAVGRLVGSQMAL